MEDPGDPCSWLFILALQNLSITAIFGLAIMALLLGCSALISGAEVSYFSLTPKDIQEISDSKSRNSSTILSLIGRPKRLLATILIANNFVNVGIIILSSYITTELFDFSRHPLLGFLIQVIAITFLILLLGEVIPKVYATKHAIRLATLMAYPLMVMERLFRPISLILIHSTSFIDKKFKKKSRDISVDELSHALELTNDEETTEEEQKILKGIVKFGNTDVKQIMKPRMDVEAIEDIIGFEQVIEKIVKIGYSRIPVIKESFDNIEGILYVKDLLPHLDKGGQFEWQSLIRAPFFVPENKKIDDLLKEFQDKKIHLAIVVDEYGGTSGIVTLEDIIEEIVGDIADEFDDEDLVYSKLDDHNYVFEGKTPLIDIYRVLDIEGTAFEEAKGESDTLAGFILEIERKIPGKNEKINFENFVFTIESSDKRRVKLVKVTILKKSEAEKAAEGGKNQHEKGAN